MKNPVYRIKTVVEHNGSYDYIKYQPQVALFLYFLWWRFIFGWHSIERPVNTIEIAKRKIEIFDSIKIFKNIVIN